MNRMLRALASGAVGSTVLTLLHESARRLIPHAPRMDVIGMRAIARSLRQVDQEPPPHDQLFRATLLVDLVSNALYYSLVGVGNAQRVWVRGGLLGLLAGLGGAFLPRRMGLGEQPGARFPATQAMTVGWYLVGGLAAAAAYRRFQTSDR